MERPDAIRRSNSVRKVVLIWVEVEAVTTVTDRYVSSCNTGDEFMNLIANILCYRPGLLEGESFARQVNMNTCFPRGLWKCFDLELIKYFFRCLCGCDSLGKIIV